MDVKESAVVSKSLRVLILEDQLADAELMCHELRQAGFVPVWTRVETQRDYLARLPEDWDVILADYGLPQFNALDALRLLQKQGLNIPFIVVSGSIGEDVAVECMKNGAADYLFKDRLARLGPSVVHALDQKLLIGERKKAEEAVRFHADLLDAVGQAVVATDINHNITYWNRAAETDFGWLQSEALGRSVLDLVAPDVARQQVVDMISQVTAGNVWSGELECLRRDGSIFPVLLTFSPVRGDDGGLAGLIGVSTDITERRNLENQLRQAHKMEALGQMASGVVHDFNNALSPILGYSDLLLMDASCLEDQDKTKEYLHRIKTAAQAAAGVVRRLREFYRPRDDREEFHPVDLNPVVVEAISLTQSRWQAVAQAQGIQISVASDLAEIPRVSGSEAQLRDLLMNLIFNAVDAMPDGGTLTLRTQTDEGRVVLQVEDTGTGMTEEVRRHCMEPWFTTKGDKGTGLGLAMVYGTVQRHNGAIDIESKVGKGTIFTIRLPEQVATEGGAESPPTQTQVKPLHVLVVDDELQVRQVLADYLTMDGHQVEAATDGREGLEKFLGGQFDLAVLDMAMPELSGTQLTVILKQLAPHVPVISISGFGDLLARSGSADLILSKPVTLEELRQAVAKVMTPTGKETSRNDQGAGNRR